MKQREEEGEKDRERRNADEMERQKQASVCIYTRSGGKRHCCPNAIKIPAEDCTQAPRDSLLSSQWVPHPAQGHGLE